MKQSWNMDTLFGGGSTSPEFIQYVSRLEADVIAFSHRVAAWQTQEANLEEWAGLFATMQDLLSRLKQAMAFASCLSAQDVSDQEATRLVGRVQHLKYSGFSSAMAKLDQHLLAMSDRAFEQLLADRRLLPIAFALQERRQRAAEKLPAEQEALYNDLSVDGYHAWSTLYNTIVGRIRVPFASEGEGEPEWLSVGQAANVMTSPVRSVRQQMFAAYEKAFSEQGELIGAALNHLAGFRLQAYAHRGWDCVLSEPLANNRLSQQTLQVMWETITRNKAPFVAYLRRKAELLGIEKLGWSDMYAPIGETSGEMSFDEGASFIVEQFRKFSAGMAALAERAFVEQWIEAENRPGKRAGGFCSSFPESGQSRVFMTYDGSPGSVSTLAHELGHAYHQNIMAELPPLVQSYTMSLAETASIFAETIVADAAVKQAADDEERIVLLENKLQNATAFFMDIHTRFLFEQRFYAERKNGLVSVERLNELMIEAQEEAFCGELEEKHPLFWASKLHFYSTSTPFYNFPYTFGYLFSTGVYARALEEGASFADRYVELLRDTGRMTVEELALQHLGADLTEPEFWQHAIDRLAADAQEFLRLTERKVGGK